MEEGELKEALWKFEADVASVCDVQAKVEQWKAKRGKAELRRGASSNVIDKAKAASHKRGFKQKAVLCSRLSRPSAMSFLVPLRG